MPNTFTVITHSATPSNAPAPGHADNEVRGVLYKRTSGAIRRWAPRYFKLNRDSLSYAHSETGDPSWSVNLTDIASVRRVTTNSGMLLRFSDGSEVEFRAREDGDASRWIHAIEARLHALSARRLNRCIGSAASLSNGRTSSAGSQSDLTRLKDAQWSSTSALSNPSLNRINSGANIASGVMTVDRRLGARSVDNLRQTAPLRASTSVLSSSSPGTKPQTTTQSPSAATGSTNDLVQRHRPSPLSQSHQSVSKGSRSLADLPPIGSKTALTNTLVDASSQSSAHSRSTTDLYNNGSNGNINVHMGPRQPTGRISQANSAAHITASVAGPPSPGIARASVESINRSVGAMNGTHAPGQLQILLKQNRASQIPGSSASLDRPSSTTNVSNAVTPQQHGSAHMMISTHNIITEANATIVTHSMQSPVSPVSPVHQNHNQNNVLSPTTPGSARTVMPSKTIAGTTLMSPTTPGSVSSNGRDAGLEQLFVVFLANLVQLRELTRGALGHASSRPSDAAAVSVDGLLAIVDMLVRLGGEIVARTNELAMMRAYMPGVGVGDVESSAMALGPALQVATRDLANRARHYVAAIITIGSGSPSSSTQANIVVAGEQFERAMDAVADRVEAIMRSGI